MALPVNGSTHLIPAYYSFIDPERMKGWVGLLGWPVADGLPTLVVTHQLQVERRTGKVRQSETDVLPLCHTTNYLYKVTITNKQRPFWAMWCQHLCGQSGNESVNDKLFKDIMIIPNHVLHQMLHKQSFTAHNLRHRRHNRTLPSKQGAYSIIISL